MRNIDVFKEYSEKLKFIVFVYGVMWKYKFVVFYFCFFQSLKRKKKIINLLEEGNIQVFEQIGVGKI